MGKTIENMKLKMDDLLDPRYKMSMYSAVSDDSAKYKCINNIFVG